jgi:hypothetical protein
MPSDEQGLQLFWRADQPHNLPYSDKICNLANNRFYKSFSSFDVMPKFKNVLFAFLVGDDSVRSESVSDNCIIDVIYEMLMKFFPGLNLPRPVSVVRFVALSYTLSFLGNTLPVLMILTIPKNQMVYQPIR